MQKRISGVVQRISLIYMSHQNIESLTKKSSIGRLKFFKTLQKFLLYLLIQRFWSNVQYSFGHGHSVTIYQIYLIWFRTSIVHIHLPHKLCITCIYMVYAYSPNISMQYIICSLEPVKNPYTLHMQKKNILYLTYKLIYLYYFILHLI